MRAPHFITLAKIDEAHLITACRHGVVHLSWGRASVRFSRGEFERLASLVRKVADAPPPATEHERELRVISRIEEDSELRVGPVVILMNPDEWQAFTTAMKKAMRTLSSVLSSGAWSEPDEDEHRGAPPNPLAQLRDANFSDN